MIAAKRFLFIAAAVAAFQPGAAGAMIQPEVGSMSCALFLSDIATNPPSYNLYLTFVQGYLAARTGAKDAAFHPDDRGVLASVTDYCQTHAKQDFDAAIAATVKP
jgi:hypothetical protein